MKNIAIVYPREESVGREALSLYFIRDVAFSMKIKSKLYFLDSPNLEEMKTTNSIFISCHYENNYPNILKILNKSGLSIFRDKRKVPVFLGGPTTANPFPLYYQVDYFVVGDGDNVFEEVLSLDEEKLLSKDYIFAPEKKETAKSNVCLSLGYHPVDMFSESFLMEVQRGCRNNCLFCLIGWTKKPVRFRSLEDVKSIYSRISNRKYSKVMLVGSDVFSNPEIVEIIRYLKEKGLDVSFPSMRVDEIEKYADLIKETKISSITLAPESSERIRLALGKRFVDDDFLYVADLLKHTSVSSVKLYFMIGLPFEKMEDVYGIADLYKNFKKIFGSNVKATASIFVPKARTPLQFSPLPKLKELEQKNALLRKHIGFVHLTNPKKARIQAWLSIGNKDISKLLSFVFERGLNYSEWLKASKKLGIDLEKYEKEKDLSFSFDFDSIDFGVSKKTLFKLYENYKLKLV